MYHMKWYWNCFRKKKNKKQIVCISWKAEFSVRADDKTPCILDHVSTTHAPRKHQLLIVPAGKWNSLYILRELCSECAVPSSRTPRLITYCLFLARQPPVGDSLLNHEVSRSHNDAPQSVGLLWTSDHPVAETSTWQHTTLTTNIHAPGGIRTHDFSRRVAVDLRLRPRGHWDRQLRTVLTLIFVLSEDL